MRFDHLVEKRSFGRYILAGIVNTTVGLVVFPVLFLILGGVFPIQLILAMSYVFCTTFAFVSHKLMVFQTETQSRIEFPKFFLLSCATFAINLLLLPPAIELSKMHPVIVQFGLAVALSVGNYVVMKTLIFTTTKSK